MTVTSEFLAFPTGITLTVVRYVGTMEICVAKMLKESGIFFAVGVIYT